MEPTPKTKGFTYSIVLTVFFCVFITLYCIKFGEPWTHNLMDDTVFYIQAGQIVIAIVIAVIFALFKFTRKNGLWCIIPLILIAFSFLYDFILTFVYPCC